MSKRLFILGLLLAAFLGGMIALSAFKYLLTNPPYETFEQKQKVRFSNYIPDTTISVPAGLNFVYAADLVRPGVVHVKTIYEGRNDDAVNEMFRDYHGFGSEQPFHSPSPQESAGSGVIISGDGYIVTNNHVIEKASKIEVVLEDKRSYSATVVGTDPTTDLALLKIDADHLRFVRYGNFDKLMVGEWVLAVGNPFDLTSTVTAGIVSAKGRDIHILKDQDGMQVESFIQTDAAVNPGNSGGALVNLKGELVGINTAIATQTGVFSGYSFAVPVTLVKKVMEDLLKYGEVQRGMLGIQINEVTADLAEEKNLKSTQGVYISGINQGEAADLAGFVPGDVIIQIDGLPVNAVAELQGIIATHRPGDQVKITFERKGKAKTVDVILKNRKGSTTIVKREEKLTSQVLGSDLQSVSKKEQGILGIKGGVKVIRTGPGKIKDAGIKAGFVITKLTLSGASEAEVVNSPEDITRIVDREPEAIWIEGFHPDGKRGYYAINP